MSQGQATVISPMIVVSEGLGAIDFYKRALGAKELWVIGNGQVAALEVFGAPLLLSQENQSNGTLAPATARGTTVRIELFCDDPDSVLARAREAGAMDVHIEDHDAPWGKHRQGGFTDPFGHHWLVGDRSPLGPFPP